MKKILFLTLFLFLYHIRGRAQTGMLDPAFGTEGHVVVRNDFAATVFQQDGKLLGVVKDGVNLLLYRYNTDGSADASFSNGGVANAILPPGDEIISVTETADGKIVVLNNITNAFPIGKMVIIRLEKNGLPDRTFGENGVTIANYGSIHGANFLADVATQGAAEMIVSARIGGPGGSYMEYSRFNAAGERISTGAFAAAGYFHTGPTSIAIQDDGKIVVGGFASRLSPIPGNQFGLFLLRLNKDGTPDATFGTKGTVVSDISEDLISLVIDGRGNIVFSGSGNKLIRYTNNGYPDGSFGSEGVVKTDFQVNKLLIESDGKILAGGVSDGDFAVGRYTAAGLPDQAFGMAGKTISNFGGDENVADIQLFRNHLFAYGTGILAAYSILDIPTVAKIVCPADIVAGSDPGKCGALVNYPSVQLVDQYGQPIQAVSPTFTITQTAGLTTGAEFPVGTTTNTFAIDADATKQTCSFIVRVSDQQGPEINGLSTSTSSIWPPNHKMQDVELFYTLADNCATPDVVLSVTSSELPILGNKEAASGDWQIIDAHHIQLRAEKSGNESRLYTVTITATDQSGHATQKQAIVTVPGDHSGQRVALGSKEMTNVAATESAELFVRVFSNPAPVDFTLLTSSSVGTPLHLKIYDAIGRLVEVRNSLAANGTIIIGNAYRPGIYFAEVGQGGRRVVVKLIKR